MPAQLAIELLAELSELERLIVSIDTFGLAQGWSPASLLQVKLSVEELAINVMSHGSDGHSLPRILLNLVEEAGQLTVHMADNGLPFDPLQQPVPDLALSLEDRPIGGLGIFLLREFMDDITYQRDGDWNRTRLVKTLH